MNPHAEQEVVSWKAKNDLVVANPLANPLVEHTSTFYLYDQSTRSLVLFGDDGDNTELPV